MSAQPCAGAFDPAACLAPFAGAPVSRIVVAVSGGSDSTALLIAAAGMASALPPLLPPLLAVTVDHGLRPAASGEARAVAALSDALGIAHRVVALPPAPATGIAAWARATRHGALHDAAGAGGIVLLGHTADDRAETVLMRRARGDGPGLAGIAPATLVGETWFYRPLIGAGRHELRQWLRSRGVRWMDDPSNADPASERARVRAGMTAKDRRDALRIAARHGAERARDAERASFLIGDRLRLAAHGATIDDWEALGAHRAAVLRVLLPRVAGRAHAPSPSVVERAIRALDHGSRFTAGGCQLRLERPFAGAGPFAHDRPSLRVERDPRARTDDGPRLVPSFDWPLHRAIVAHAPAPPVPLGGWG